MVDNGHESFLFLFLFLENTLFLFLCGLHYRLYKSMIYILELGLFLFYFYMEFEQ